MIYDLVIIGGGASGIACYHTYKKKNPNSKVLIIERNKELLKKFSQTGNGKCNFTNFNLDYHIFNNGEFYKNIFENGLNRIFDYYNYFNVKYFKDTEGRYYPISESAKNVRDLLILDINENDYTLNTVVINIEKNDNYFVQIKKEDGILDIVKTRNLVITCGSKNYPQLGSDGILFDSIKKLGHHFTDIYPSNVYINISNINFKKLIEGFRTRVNLYLYNDDKLVYNEIGEILFKEKAISGIVAFNVSNRLANLYKLNCVKNPYLIVDFLPYTNENEFKASENVLSYLDNKLLPLFKNAKEPLKMAKKYRFDIESLGGFDFAQSASGGIVKEELKDSLESKINKGLYFAGDILDCDAPCGGYSLSFAVLSGIKVGENIE